MDRLFFKYLAPFLAISIIPTLAIVLILFFFIRNNITELEEHLIKQDTETLTKVVSEKNEAIAKTEGLHIEQQIDKVREKLKAMQLHPDFIRLDIDNMNAYAENLFSKETSIVEFSIVNDQGDQIFQKLSSVSLEADDPLNISEEKIFKELKKKQLYTSPVDISNTTQKPFLTLAQPIINFTGNFVGGIIVKLDLEFLQDISVSRVIGSTGFTYIITEKGRLISHPSIREMYQNAEYSKYDYINEILAKKNGTVWNGENLVSFFTNRYGWATIIEVPSAEALAMVEQNKRTILSFINATLQSVANFTVLIILFGFIIATAATIFITKRILTPVINFTNATRRIAEGHFPRQLEKQSNDEFGELTDAFNKMTEELKRERDDLLKTNNAFKRQVQEIINRNIALQEHHLHITELEKPLIRVKNYLSEIKEQQNGSSTITQQVLDDIDQIDIFLKDLFDHSTITTNTADFIVTDFFSAFKTAVEKLQREIKESNANIRCSELPSLKALRSSIIQLFHNLISNAIQYRSVRPLEIVVSAKEKDQMWEFAVFDNGIGIPPEEHENIFQVREKTENGISRFQFGLALCRTIVERHGGSIWAEGNSTGGSTLYFTIKKM